LNEEDLSRENLLEKIDQLYADREKYADLMKASPVRNGTEEVIKMIGIYSK